MLVIFREAARFGVRGLPGPDHGPVHHAGGPGPGVARRVPQVCGLRVLLGRVLHVLRPRRQDLLQERLPQVYYIGICVQVDDDDDA
jgi:hypothetical protein